jgi:hypothetical protein
MLTDSERKMLAILRNFHLKHKHMPSLHLMSAKTGRNETGIYKVLQSLSDKGYVKWSQGTPIDAVELLNAWEEAPISFPTAPRGGAWWEALADERSP